MMLDDPEDQDSGSFPCSNAFSCDDCLHEEACVLEQVMTRPLFDRSFENIAREDEWSGPYGFLFDPMTYPTPTELSGQFLRAADQLTEAILAKDVADYTLAYPAMFLYRHAVELIVKNALGGDAEGHKLADLADELARRCGEQQGQDAPGWITRRLKEIAEVDPNSTAFRYAQNWDAKSKQRVPFHGEFHVNLRHLQRSMTMLHKVLNGAVGKLRPPIRQGARTGRGAA